ncbi:MAG: DNA (cytosine-5-)-methyltransferase [Phycisphaeraceae bacterium]|nr:MAG: DNA (cytosine-5-)-methyltransferase [Phycisphaeraceae bacterium]
MGKPIRLHVDGLGKVVETDLPTDRAGRPRWFFRDRRWLREFLQLHELTAGDSVLITRQSTYDYKIAPAFRDPRFIDLFAGIGGMRLGFESAGARCVFSCEWDKHAQRTYEENFGDKPAGDIRLVDAQSVPDHDILLAGFPCQPFSIAGVSKKNALGHLHGFKCKTQGTLFFDVARIIEAKQPRCFVLENVKNLENHDKGRTFATILDTLTKELGYHVTHRVIDARHVVPQHRQRVFIIGSKPPAPFDFPTARDLEKYRLAETVGQILERRVDPRYTLTDHLWKYLQNYAKKHRAAGNGFGFGLVNRSMTTRTLSARYYKDGSEILIEQKGKNPRRLTPRECARLMGYPDSFRIPVSDTQAYRQFGNSIVVPIVQSIADRLIPAMRATPGIASGQQLVL